MNIPPNENLWRCYWCYSWIGGDMMNKNKEILKYTGGGFLAYIVPCLLGAYVGFYQGADLQFIVQLAGFVTIFIVVSAMVCLFRKKYDCRIHNGYIYLFSSLGLLLQVMFQGSILGEKRVIICITSYIFAFILGILILLLAMKKIVIKNKFIREIGEVVGIGCGFSIAFMIRVGKTFSGRRGEVIYGKIGAENSTKLMWFIILFMACIYGLICSINITSSLIKDEPFK